MKLEIINIKGEKTNKEADLSDDIFAIKPNDHAIWLDVKRILAAARQGTHSSKEKGDITGSTRKLKRQKGTGTARAGSIKSPVFRGGGRVFGPLPRDYTMKINKKVALLARKSALAYKALDNKIIVLEDFNLEAAKTKEYFGILKTLNLATQKNLLITATSNSELTLSIRNLPKAFVCTPENLNTYNILNNETLLITESAVGIINEKLK